MRISDWSSDVCSSDLTYTAPSALRVADRSRFLLQQRANGTAPDASHRGFDSGSFGRDALRRTGLPIRQRRTARRAHCRNLRVEVSLPDRGGKGADAASWFVVKQCCSHLPRLSGRGPSKWEGG